MLGASFLKTVQKLVDFGSDLNVLKMLYQSPVKYIIVKNMMGQNTSHNLLDMHVTAHLPPTP